MTIPLFAAEPEALLDDFAIELACEGVIDVARLNSDERDEVVRRLAATDRYAVDVAAQAGVSRRTVERVRAELRREAAAVTTLPARRAKDVPAGQLGLLRELAATSLDVAVIAERTGVRRRVVEEVRRDLRREASAAATAAWWRGLRAGRAAQVVAA
ncbi:hypothetical protein [Amycolatopsis kentuckyensis]|uniref:hypothetical protein n=1 Tax=Amycolatopsis kentuckyensis TaxID=218823 RepID=UPI003565B9EB